MTKDPKIPEPVSTPMGGDGQDLVIDDSSLEEFLDYFQEVADSVSGD